MPLNATTSLPLPRTDPETMRTTGGSEATALPDTATAAHTTHASLSVRRMVILRRALELCTESPIIVMCFPESCVPYSFSPDCNSHRCSVQIVVHHHQLLSDAV